MGSQAFPKKPGASSAARSGASPGDARAALDAIRRIVRMLRESSGAAERRAGVSGAQLFVLQQLRAGAALSLRELAERTATHESSVSVVVQRLVDSGRVARRKSRLDGRCVELSLLARGRALLRRAPPLAQEKLIGALEQLDPRDRRSLAKSLEALVARLGLGAQAPEMFFESRGAARGR